MADSGEVYFREAKFIQQMVGLWPFGNRVRNISLRVLCGSAVIGMAIPQIRALKKTIGVSNDEAFYNIAINLYISLTFMKLFTSITSENKIRSLIANVQNNWNNVVGDDERAILIKYSEDGTAVVRIYLIIFIGGYFVFLLSPLLPIVLETYKPLDKPRPRIYLVGGDFGFDTEGYYIYIYVYDVITSFMTCAIIGAADILYVICVQHCIGLFAVAGHRLQTTRRFIDNNNSEEADITYRWLVETIKWHKQGLRYAEVLEDTFSSSFLVLIGINLVYFSVLSIVIVINVHNPINLMRYSIVGVGCTLQIFFISWPGQKLSDRSSGLYLNAYLNEWYGISAKSKTLLKVIYLRSIKPSMLTAGGMYVMSLQNFAMVMKTSISYITVLSSFR